MKKFGFKLSIDARVFVEAPDAETARAWLQEELTAAVVQTPTELPNRKRITLEVALQGAIGRL
jgi:hypothetical protein